MESQEIKALTPATCPHCNKQFVVAFKMSAPQLTGVLTSEMIEGAKADAIRRIGELAVPQEQKQPALDWVNSPDTMFGPADIDEIIENITKQNDHLIEA